VSREKQGEAEERQGKLWECFHKLFRRRWRNGGHEVMDDFPNLIHGLGRNL
jgi:hypothetical protein